MIHCAVVKNRLPIVRELIEKYGIDPKSTNEVYATTSYSYTLIKSLVVSMMKNGLQPVHMAASCGHVDVLRYLHSLPGIDFGALSLHEVN